MTPTYDVAIADRRLKIRGWATTPEGCWEVSGFRLDNGYSQVYHKGIYWLAHRLAYVAWVGPLPTGHLVRHRCDNRSCINPDHLVSGTHQDNMDDKVARSRCAVGENHGVSKLTDAKVREIVALRKCGWSLYKLAARYGVSRQCVGHVVSGKTWRHVTNDILS